MYKVPFEQTIGRLGALAVYLDALETEIFVHQPGRQQGYRLFQKFIQTLAAVVLGNFVFFQKWNLHAMCVFVPFQYNVSAAKRKYAFSAYFG